MARCTHSLSSSPSMQCGSTTSPLCLAGGTSKRFLYVSINLSSLFNRHKKKKDARCEALSNSLQDLGQDRAGVVLDEFARPSMTE
eukprot:CAMPEP_0175971358 /NCGR_PEP_ID=MMETSP0108-20121206/41610_1 /TAXON_ID=195067 ORGANISM="Goniomonas pacifica, Strain CCMP1869" /NCGR_SAMPLE_ID=MMETSP0108 /ASSEMBLY_ACC=CAM_ASM_000204 /LENGTH=84 /DNA_ID=CAMNT_0017300517 /DNA_START=74 /DNA_END=324 /DNA_ORIENTATION=+